MILVSKMSVKKCCVPNCNKSRADNTILHLFPNPKENMDRFKSWTNAIGGEILLLDDRTIFECRRVCHSHFEPQYHTRSKRLSSDAVPSVHLQVIMAHEWNGKVVLITGAATAIGATVVRILMEEKVKHIAVLDINEKAGVALQNELNSKYGANKVKFFKCDVTNEEQFLGCFKAVVDDQGYLDVVVNNAGIMNDSLQSYKKMIDVNVTALVTGTLKAIDIMSKENGGRGGTVINISSIVALYQEHAIFPIYFGTKSAVLQFSNCIGSPIFYERTGVRVITLCFGATDTPLLDVNNLGSFDKTNEAGIGEALKGFPFQKPESAAQGVVDAYKKAESGSTWIATTDRLVKDITPTITKAYELMSVHVFE